MSEGGEEGVLCYVCEKHDQIKMQRISPRTLILNKLLNEKVEAEKR